MKKFKNTLHFLGMNKLNTQLFTFIIHVCALGKLKESRDQ
jgi:hypothetical protein